MDVLRPDMIEPGDSGGIDDGVLGEGGEGVGCCATGGRKGGVLMVRPASPPCMV